MNVYKIKLNEISSFRSKHNIIKRLNFSSNQLFIFKINKDFILNTGKTSSSTKLFIITTEEYPNVKASYLYKLIILTPVSSYYIDKSVSIKKHIKDIYIHSINRILDWITCQYIIRYYSSPGYSVIKHIISINEIFETSKSDILQKSFGRVTDIVISPTKEFLYKNKKFSTPNEATWILSCLIYDTISDIQNGTLPDTNKLTYKGTHLI